MIKNKQPLLIILICIASILYFLFLSEGLPLRIDSIGTKFLFSWSSRYRNIPEILIKIVKFVPNGLEYYDRPVKELVFRILYTILGLNPIGYYFLKVLVLAGIVFLIATLLKDKKWMAIYGGLFYFLSPPVYLDVILPGDIGLASGLLTFLCFCLFLKIYLNEKIQKNKVVCYSLQALIILLGLLANRAEGRARIIPFVLLFFIFFDNRRKIFRYWLLLTGLFLQVLPLNYLFKAGNIIQQAASDFPYGIDFSKIYKLFIFNPYHNTFFGASLLGVMGILSFWMISAVFFINRTKIILKDKALFLLSGIWLFWTMITSVVYSYVEPHKLSNSLIPATLLIFLALYYLENLFKDKKKFLPRNLMYISIILTLVINFGKTLVLRDRNTAYLVVHHNLNRFIEETEKARDSLVLIYRGGSIRTQANINSTNTYLPALAINIEDVYRDLKIDKDKFRDIYLISGMSPVKNSEITGLKYLSSVNSFDTSSIYGMIRKMIFFSAAYTFYIYKYTGKPLTDIQHRQGRDTEITDLKDFIFSGNYIYVDYEMGCSGTLKLKKIDRDKVQTQMTFDESWGESVECYGKILKDRVRIEVSKKDVMEIIFKKDHTFVCWWAEGECENADCGHISGKLIR